MRERMTPRAPNRDRPGARTPLALLACVSLQLACGAPPASPSPSPPAAARRPVLVLGIDAGDWSAIDPLVEAGRLPTFARLKAGGRTGVLRSEPPLVSPIVWTTIATGRPPEEHGVLDFMVDLPGGGQAPVGAASRRVPALWNLFSEAGRSVGIVGLWATWPAEAVRGTIVSDRVAPQLTRPDPLDPQSISPAAAWARLAPLLVRPEAVSEPELGGYVPLTRAEYEAAGRALRGPAGRLYADPVAHLAAAVAATRAYAAMAEAILREGQPDLLFVYDEEVDTLSHLFVRDPRRGPGAIAAAYRDADALLARLAALVTPDTWVVVCSDHGFYGPDAAIDEDPAGLPGPATAWHRPYGIVAAAEAGVLAGRRPGRGATLGAVMPIDIAPTLLHLAGLPVTTRMPGHVVPALLPEEAAARPVTKAEVLDPQPSTPAAAGPGDAEAEARLRALGYVGATATSLARLNLGEILYRRGRLDAAERELRGVLADQPDNVAALLWLGKALRDAGKPREALAVYARAARLGAAEAAIEAADCAVSAGSAADAGPVLASLEPTPRTAAALAVARSIVARAAGDVAGAERELRAALAADPLGFEALSRLLDLSVAAGRAKTALPPIRRAAGAAPGSARHAALLGEALLAAGDPAAAEAALSRALALAPDSSPARIDLARAELGRGDPGRALATLAEAAPSLERALLRGAAFSASKRWEDAVREYRTAVGLSKQPTPELLNALAWAELQSGRGDEAASLLDRSLSIKQDQPEIRRMRAQLGGARRP